VAVDSQAIVRKRAGRLLVVADGTSLKLNDELTAEG